MPKDEKAKREPTRHYYVLRGAGEHVALTTYDTRADVIEAITSGKIDEADPIYLGHLKRVDVVRSSTARIVNGMAGDGEEKIDVVTRKG